MAPQQSSHVPRFGSWDNDNIPYTAYFENARRERSGTGPIFNPNDPEENPEAFMYYRGDESDADFSVVQTPLHHTAQRSNSAQKKITSEPDRKSNRRPKKPDRNPAGFGSEESDRSFSTVSVASRHHRLKSRSNIPDDEYRHQKLASVPKFGSWDEKDQKSGEGFSVIFNQVKEEKQIASATFPSIPTHAIHYSQHQKPQGQGDRFSYRSMFCCCLFSRRGDYDE